MGKGKGVNLQVNLIEQQELEPTYLELQVQLFGHYEMCYIIKVMILLIIFVNYTLLFRLVRL